MGKKMVRKQGFKRPKISENKGTRSGVRQRKQPRIEEKSEEILADDTHLEQFGDDVALLKESSAYKNLLMSLKSRCESLLDAYSDSASDESESLADEATESDLPQQSVDDDLKEHEGFEVKDDSQSSDSNPDNEMEVHSDHDDSVEEPVYMRTFNAHFGHSLSKEDTDHIMKNKSKYNWETPALEMSNCKWLGTGDSFMEDDNINPEYGLKPSLYEHWINIYKASGGDDFHSSKERIFFTLCSQYRDILHCNKKPFYQKAKGEDFNIMDAYIMHCLNHIYKTGDLVRKNDTKAKNEEVFEKMGDCIHDQGFTRPKVLILLPLRSIAHRVVKRLIQLTPPTRKVNVEHMDRFNDDFGIEDSVDNDNEEGVSQDERGSAQKSSKPSDFLALFNGNSDDHFMIGIKFTRKSVILYNDFYTSDMIIASPLGVITKIGEAESEKDKDVNYLSSIEILIVDHADVIAMQNWSHVSTVVEQLNRVPKNLDLGRTDIRRIREWYLNGYAKFYRQSIILSYYSNPDINAIFNHHFMNYKGKVKLVCEYNGVLPKVLLQVRQIYERFDAKTIEEADDARLDYFTKKVFPKLKDSVQGGIMLFISSYFEFVRVRNFLKSQNASFCLIGEYTKQSDISRSRVWFFEGKRKIMLYTERAHFYHRYKIRGMHNLIIYSLPERKEFYPEIVNMLEESSDMTCSVIFSRFDFLRLERIVGTRAAKKMITSDKSVFVYC